MDALHFLLAEKLSEKGGPCVLCGAVAWQHHVPGCAVALTLIEYYRIVNGERRAEELASSLLVFWEDPQ